HHEARHVTNARAVDPLDLGAAHVQRVGQLRGAERRVAVLAQPCDRDPHANCPRRRTSFSKNMRRSGTPWRRNAIRSMPMPNAKPCTRSGSYPLSATKPSTLGSTIPAPRISIQPEPLQSGSREPSDSVPLPPQRKHDTSTSTLGSVNGK